MSGDRHKTRRLYATLLIVVLIAAGCAQPQPSNISDACGMLEDRKDWYAAVHKAEKRWKIPMSITMAFIHQESSFKHNAKPPRRKLLGFIPWFRVSSAYGYSQALDQSWQEYKDETGKVLARRASFTDSADFIGWYNDKTARSLGISRNDAYSLYLAYHEGRGGYKRKTYAKKKWLMEAANKVKKNTAIYKRQLKQCGHKLQYPWFHFLPWI